MTLPFCQPLRVMINKTRMHESIGIIQFVASASEGMWYARSESFMQQDLLETLRWVRTVGDVLFIVGAVAVSWQVVKRFFGIKTQP